MLGNIRKVLNDFTTKINIDMAQTSKDNVTLEKDDWGLRIFNFFPYERKFLNKYITSETSTREELIIYINYPLTLKFPN